jgi:membrane protease YdiL (CAAX protease family)
LLGASIRADALQFERPLAFGLFFAVVFHAHVQRLMAAHGIAGFVVFPVLAGVLWGIVQELLYRGWLQTELTRRFGAATGLVASTAIFTFGPLHLDHFFGPSSGRRGTVPAIFAVGLVFGLVYRRSGNLWLPAELHGLWPPNMT